MIVTAWNAADEFAMNGLIYVTMAGSAGILKRGELIGEVTNSLDNLPPGEVLENDAEYVGDVIKCSKIDWCVANNVLQCKRIRKVGFSKCDLKCVP